MTREARSSKSLAFSDGGQWTPLIGSCQKAFGAQPLVYLLASNSSKELLTKS
jgi:hypothetical protein